MPFQFAGILYVINAAMLSFDRNDTQEMLESRGISASPAEINEIHRHTKGYPVGMDVLCNRLKDGTTYSLNLLNEGKIDVFNYFEEAVFLRFERPLRNLLVVLAPFESFSLGLTKVISGDPRAGELLATIQRDTTMLHYDGKDTYYFWPFFRQFLTWEMHQKLTDKEERMLYGRAALYYELEGELDQALKYYSLARDQSKVSDLLVKNANQHPGVGFYREMQHYYFSLSKEEILKSPPLIYAMSMLSALCMDYETSEDWYRELQNYAASLKKTDAEYKRIQGKLAYLDIALPQRNSKGLVHVMSNVFKMMVEQKFKMPAFSVTSTLPSIMNGGKDFCEWSKKDDLLYKTMKIPVETVLGKDGVGLADCGICESKFEKGEDISKRLLTLMTRLGEIQIKGTSDMEFAVIGLLARVQVSQGKAKEALESLESMRNKFIEIEEERFLYNIDAMICRIHMRLGESEKVTRWLREKSPKNDVRLWGLWRYQYMTKIMAQIGQGDHKEALLLLARLLAYCKECHRVMDEIHIRILTGICYKRLGDKAWKMEIKLGLDRCYEYGFIWPIAQYGVAVLTLLDKCGWNEDKAYLNQLIQETRVQAVQYPKFLQEKAKLMEPLTGAENLVLKLLCENLSNKEIGEILGIKVPTVKTHVSRILTKLDVSRRGEVEDVAKKLHLI